MYLPPVLLRLKSVVLSQFKLFNWTQNKKRIHQFSSNTLRKISWKSPQVIIGLSITIILTGGLTYYLSTTTSAAAVMINGQQIGLVHNVTTGRNLVDTILKQ